MTVSTASDLNYDPYDVDLNLNPYPVFARLREEAPLYYNEQHDFYALSRFDDVNKALHRPRDVHLRPRGACWRSSSPAWKSRPAR